ncbi:MAG: hypothetical protein WCF17_16735 [Terracidiphilus sp.]
MKAKLGTIAVQLVMIMAALSSLSPPCAGQTAPTDTKVLLGIWQGQGAAQETGIPFVTLTLIDDGGNLYGAILLSVIRLEQGKRVASAPGIPEPILNPSFDGRTLRFQIRYRGPLPPGISSDGPVLTYRLKLTPPNKAELAMGGLVADAEAITGSPVPLGPPIQMVRTAN